MDIQSIPTNSKLLQMFLTEQNVKHKVVEQSTLVWLNSATDLFYLGLRYAKFKSTAQEFWHGYNIIYKVDDVFISSVDDYEAKTLDEIKAHIDFLTK